MQLGDLIASALAPGTDQFVIDSIRAQANFAEQGAALAQGWSAPGLTATIENTTIVNGCGNVVIDASGVKGYNNAILTFHLQTDGDFFIGQNITLPANTSFSFFSNAQTYNGESIGAGDALFGDNTSGSANMLWDFSDKQLKWRGGTNVQAWIDTDGSAFFSGGAVRFSTSALSAELVTNGGFETVIPYATGGTVSVSGGKRIHKFTSSDTLTVVNGGTIERLVIGGGGSGGSTNSGGGGGAGAVEYSAAESITPGAKTVTIGNGGTAVGGLSDPKVGITGDPTILGVITAVGGGGGGMATGLNGGSGGGGGNGSGSGGTATHGYNGGASTGGSGKGGGGGGGASAVGADGSGANGGNGGAGVSYSISGSSVAYAGGGGGGDFLGTPGTGGSSIGGHGGGASSGAPTAGAANTGSGGGGAGNRASGAGGSGVVIVSYTNNDGTTPFASWVGTPGDGVIAQETTLVHGDSYAAKLTSGATSNTKLSQVEAVTAVGAYQLRFWTRGNGTYAGRYAVYDVTNSAYIIAATSTGNITTTYSQVTTQFITPAGCVSIRIELWCPSTNGGIAYFDDVHCAGLTIGNAIIGGQIQAGSLQLGTGGSASKIDVDGTMAANSDANIPSQKAVVTYVAAHSGTGGGNLSRGWMGV
jgi:hypothetical protein